MIKKTLTITAALVLSAMVLAAIAGSYIYVYDLGNDAGYWEHEAEENIYNCEVIT